MMRLLLLPLFLFSLSMACMGQTFQYSRGWTNGKRALNPTSAFLDKLHVHRSNNMGYTDIYELQEWNSERKLELCLAHLQQSMINRKCAPGLELNINRVDTESPDSIPHIRTLNDNIESPSIMNRHRLANELFERLNSAAGGSAERNYFSKH